MNFSNEDSGRRNRLSVLREYDRDRGPYENFSREMGKIISVGR
jgi:hypothetical protein